MSRLEEIKNWFRKQFKMIDLETNIRERKIHTKDIFYLMCQMINKKCGYQEILSEMRIDNLIGEVSPQAFNQRITSGKYVQPFYKMNQEFIEHFLINNKNERVYAVDGSKVNLSISMTNCGFDKFKNRPYTTGMISTIYDVNHQIPMEYQLSTSLNERYLFYNQLTNLKTSGNPDIFIFDRGYYSSEMVDKLTKKFKNYIFRVRNNLQMVDALKNSRCDELFFTKDQRPMRLVRYLMDPRKDYPPLLVSGKFKLQLKSPAKRKDQTYYLLTSLVDTEKYPLSKLKELYHKRWSIEEYYKKIKRTLISGTFHSRCQTSIETEMSIQQMINLLTRYFSNHVPQYKNYPINQKITSDLIVNKMLSMLIYDRHELGCDEKFRIIFEVIVKNIIPTRQDRKFKRIKIFPVSKHIYQENKYTNKSED